MRRNAKSIALIIMLLLIGSAALSCGSSRAGKAEKSPKPTSRPVPGSGTAAVPQGEAPTAAPPAAVPTATAQPVVTAAPAPQPVAPAVPAPPAAPATDIPFYAGPNPEPETDKSQLSGLANMQNAVYMLATAIGARAGGSAQELAAADFISAELRRYGYQTTRQAFPIPGKRTSVNVIAVDPGRPGGKTLILGAHMDTKAPAPGANDNASGVAVLLELARRTRLQDNAVDIVYCFFGTEEITGATPQEHHFGSHRVVASLTASQKKRVIGMLSVDMVGYGSTFHSRNMQRGSMAMSDAVLAYARRRGLKMTFLKDPGRYGWSDHEGFELAGIPATWLEWREDPVYHTTGDNYKHTQWPRLTTTFGFLKGFIDASYPAR